MTPACTCRGLGRCSACADFDALVSRLAARQAMRRSERAAVPRVDRLEALERRLTTLRDELVRHGHLPRGHRA